ncbi:claspin [Drosophila rhopaloa]|uniref:Claspin n=1 Tax=Drosophila rhopaloa TaxID=1041015 RepID=A0A6P4FKD3_DRORH|nr:claspin [Drosophila rhopaloa]
MSESVAETAAAAENEDQADDSMEKLEFDEGEENNVSAEDLLGGKSLMMSDDSENEDVSDLKPRKISPKARRQRMMDTDQEEDAMELGNLQAEEHISPKNKGQRLLGSNEEEEVAPSIKNKKYNIISSDSEEEQQLVNKKKPEQKKPAKKTQKKTSQVDNDQEEPEQEKPTKTDKKKKVTKNKKQPEEDNGEDSQEKPLNKEKSKKLAKNKKQMIKQQESHIDQEEDQDQDKPDKALKPKKLDKNKKLDINENNETDKEQKKPAQKQRAKKLAKNKKESTLEKDEKDSQMDIDEDSKMSQEGDTKQENSSKNPKPKKFAKNKKESPTEKVENSQMDKAEEHDLENPAKNKQDGSPKKVEKQKTKKLTKKNQNEINNEKDNDPDDQEQNVGSAPTKVKPKKVSKKNKQQIGSDEESKVNEDLDKQDQDQDLKSGNEIKQGMDSENDLQMDSDEDQNTQKPSKKVKKKKQRMDSNSEDETHIQNRSEVEVNPAKNQLKGLVDSESEPEESTAETSLPKNKLKGLVDSESEPELSNPEESAEEQETPTQANKEKPKKPKVVRESAKKALEGMQAIQSEQQRLHREAHINVPYHQPKPRTLKEFLSRRTINAPLATALAGGSPMPSKQPRKSVGLRMTGEELEAYAKLMEDRAKEATEFFKSESEPEDEEDSDNEPMELKDNPGVLDEVLDNPKTPEQPKVKEKVLETEAIMDDLVTEEAMVKDPVIEDEPIASTSAAAALRLTDDLEIQAANAVESPSKVCLITEVIELPRLDLSNISITPPSKPATPRISDAIRRLKIEKSLDVSPSLKGDANMVIDLETGDMFAKKPTGVDDLLKRLMKTREAKKHKTTETVNILSTEHGKLEMSKVSIHLHEEEIAKEPKPGAGYMKMQEQLKSLITKKRMEDLRKKQAEEQERLAEDEEEGMDVDEEYEPEEKPGYAKVTINEDEEIVEEDEEAAEEDEVAEEIKSDPDEDPEDDPVKDLEVQENSSESEQESESELEPETQGRKKNRIIKAFEDDNSDEDDLDLLQTPKPSNIAPITATQLQLSAHKLFDAETRRTASDEENELLDLCSGQFPQSQMVSSAAPSVDTAVISQIPMTQFGTSSQAPDELEGLCSGTFATQLPSQAPTQKAEEQEESQEPPVVANRIVSSDEEAKEEAQDSDKPRNKKLTKKRSKKKAKLGFSDDEESDGDVEELEEDESEGEPEEEIPETFVDYDSEENEIVVEMTKKDRKVRAANFVDKEAELSESEWGSADEDEKNMDTYDIELGDEDEFDRDKLRHELGQIHARKMLDQDIREVRKIKEMLFEEEEEGASRQRQFRWKNVEDGFSLDDHRPENSEANEGSGDEENEHLWRKIRYEREQLLLEKGLKPEAASPLSTSVINTSNSGNSIRRLNIITSKKTTVEVKKSSPFLISKTVAGKQQKSAVRGSFLVRDQQTLTKLAGLTKGSSADVDGSEGTISVKTAKAKNFVFATLTEEEHENRKRKAADLLNSSTETGVNFMKKPRLEPRREKCLIDQLL